VQQRFLIDLPLCLWDPSHRLIDSHAVAHDVTTDGFGFESRMSLEHLGRVFFELRLPDGQSVSGTARVAWNRRGDWGTWAGAHIVEMSRVNRRRVKTVIHGPGYDWLGLADRALVAGTIIAAGFLLQGVVVNHPEWFASFPWLAFGACAVAGAYLYTRW
jgi:hypothetical protein